MGTFKSMAKQSDILDKQDQTLKKLYQVLSKLEKTLMKDIEAIGPEKRVEMYAKLVRLILPTASGKKEDKVKESVLHANVFGNVLANMEDTVA